MYISLPAVLAIWVLYQTARNPYYVPNLIGAFVYFLGTVCGAVWAFIVGCFSWALALLPIAFIIFGTYWAAKAIKFVFAFLPH